ncbi:glycosyltransferase family 61 protein [uncultured Sulfitobacter sp.]|uniref:glycosyltransferase family 61 protein n=1 Tax=uncultured Sulfitobacter sp. TaxID=191468 RepID=UPI0030DD7AAB|tara:strand:+ start:19520 stop:20632 length:1113 start_codon:yes stop_codon:yes gene_type:complete
MALRFNPETPLAGEIRVVENALIVPWGEGNHRKMARPAGVFDAQGNFCIDAMTWRSSRRPTTVEPILPAEADVDRTLSGTMLYAGLSYGHFGHALCESLARLWAVDEFDGAIDAVAFIPKNPITWPERSLGMVKVIAEQLGEMPRLTAFNKPTRIERLVIAPQGFGVNDLMSGSPEFRAFTDRRLRQRVKPAGPDKIYISRSALFRKRGRFVLEDYIEAKMEAEGYTIFHPQQHDLATQLAYYKGASMIVSTDNSALHLAAFVVDPTCKIGILLRRPGTIFEDFQLQLKWFAGVTPDVVDACTRFWFRRGEKVQYNEVYSLIDFEKTGQALQRAGLIEKADWVNPTEAEVGNAVERMQTEFEMTFDEIFL